MFVDYIDITSNGFSTLYLEQYNKLPNLGCDLSNHTDILSLILAEVGMPADFRGFVDAVLGVSEGRYEFECGDYEMGNRLPTRGQTTAPDSIKKRAQRYRTPFETWQGKAAMVLIEVEHGGEKQGVRYKTLYRLPLLQAWAEAVRLVEQGDATKKDAAKIVARKLVGKPTAKSRGNKRRTDGRSLLSRNMKAAVTLAAKSLELAIERGDDPSIVSEEIKRMIDVQLYRLMYPA